MRINNTILIHTRDRRLIKQEQILNIVKNRLRDQNLECIHYQFKQQHSHSPDTAPQNRTTSLNPFGTSLVFVSSAILQTEHIFQQLNKIVQ